MNARFGGRSMLGIVALASRSSEVMPDGPAELTEYGYGPDVPEPMTYRDASRSEGVHA